MNETITVEKIIEIVGGFDVAKRLMVEIQKDVRFCPWHDSGFLRVRRGVEAVQDARCS